MSKKKICWITATYFLDVDLPLMSQLKGRFDIDWIVLTTAKNYKDDLYLLESQTYCDFDLRVLNNSFARLSQFRDYRNLLKELKAKRYDIYYFDITEYPYLYPLIKYYIGSGRTILAMHNAKTPKGARLYPLAKIYTYFGIKAFKHFQTFSRNQEEYLISKKPSADVFYAPLCLKDYGNKKNIYCKHNPTTFLFFGNIIDYKRVDLLIEAAEKLYSDGIRNFKVNICGFINEPVWNEKYRPLIKHPELFYLDLRRIPSDLVAKYFNESDFFVMPYQDIAQSGAMTVALNYDMPIIASRLDTFKEFVIDDKTGYFFDDHSANLLADKMRLCIDMSDVDYENLCKAIHFHVEETLSTQSIVVKYQNYFNKLLS